MDEVYKLLKTLKTPGESFSEELNRLVKARAGIMEFAGAWSDITEEEAKKMKIALREMRKGTRLKEIKKNVK